MAEKMKILIEKVKKYFGMDFFSEQAKIKDRFADYRHEKHVKAGKKARQTKLRRERQLNEKITFI